MTFDHLIAEPIRQSGSDCETGQRLYLPLSEEVPLGDERALVGSHRGHSSQLESLPTLSPGKTGALPGAAAIHSCF